MRFQSAQLDAYLTDGLWLRLAATANRAMAILAAGLRELDVELLNEPDVNMLFVRLPDGRGARLERADVRFYDMGGGVARFVTSFQTTEADAARRCGGCARAGPMTVETLHDDAGRALADIEVSPAGRRHAPTSSPSAVPTREPSPTPCGPGCRATGSASSTATTSPTGCWRWARRRAATCV